MALDITLDTWIRCTKIYTITRVRAMFLIIIKAMPAIYNMISEACPVSSPITVIFHHVTTPTTSIFHHVTTPTTSIIPWLSLCIDTIVESIALYVDRSSADVEGPLPPTLKQRKQHHYKTSRQSEHKVLLSFKVESDLASGKRYMSSSSGKKMTVYER